MKKRRLYLFLIAILCFIIGIFSACSPSSGGNTSGGTDADGTTRIQMTFDGQTIFVTLADNSATRDLVSRLKAGALTIELSDYGGSEKIGYPSPALDVSNANGCDPVVGNLTIYTPWGNLVAFYKDTAGYSDSLVLIGTIEGNGIEILAAQSGTFSVTIELVI